MEDIINQLTDQTKSQETELKQIKTQNWNLENQV